VMCGKLTQKLDDLTEWPDRKAQLPDFVWTAS